MEVATARQLWSWLKVMKLRAVLLADMVGDWLLGRPLAKVRSMRFGQCEETGWMSGYFRDAEYVLSGKLALVNLEARHQVR